MSIKYKLSTDYEKLFRLIDDGATIIGFVQMANRDYVSDLLPEQKEIAKIDKGKSRVGLTYYFITTNTTEDSVVKSSITISFFKSLCEKWKVEYIDI